MWALGMIPKTKKKNINGPSNPKQMLLDRAQPSPSKELPLSSHLDLFSLGSPLECCVFVSSWAAGSCWGLSSGFYTDHAHSFSGLASASWNRRMQQLTEGSVQDLTQPQLHVPFTVMSLSPRIWVRCLFMRLRLILPLQENVANKTGKCLHLAADFQSPRPPLAC